MVGVDGSPVSKAAEVSSSWSRFVINGPVLLDAFDTRALPLQTWLLVAGVALTIVPVLELAKLSSGAHRLRHDGSDSVLAARRRVTKSCRALVAFRRTGRRR
jgi:hypothetical protein